MRVFFNAQVIVQITSAFVAFMMAVFLLFHLFKGKRMALFYTYLLCQGLLFLWTLSELLEAWTVDKAGKWLTIQFQFFPACFLGASWLLLCLFYTENRWIAKRRNIILLFLPSTMMYIIMLTNESHHLFFSVFEYDRESFGIAFWLHTALSYAGVLFGVILLIRSAFKKKYHGKVQVALLAAAALSPVIANALFLSKKTVLTYGATPIPYDITPNAFSITVTLFAIVIIRYRFLNIWPLALRDIVFNMKASIVVVDSLNQVVNCNSEFARTFSAAYPRERLNSLAEFFDILRKSSDDPAQNDRIFHALFGSNPTEESSMELLFYVHTNPRWYVMNIKEITGKGRHLGRIVSLTDVSDYKNMALELDKANKELRVKNDELLSLNRQLEEYAATVEELTLTAERNRFARDMHDTLGNTMALIIKMLEASEISCKTDNAETEEQIREAAAVAREGLKELRRSMFGLVPEKLENEGLTKALERLVADFRNSGLEVDLTVEDSPTPISSAYSFTLYKICQEALTNSMKHGHAENVTIILKETENIIRLVIIDDGRGCRGIKKGFGLSGMEQRVKAVNGMIVFHSDGESGFNIKVEIPVV